MANFAICAKSRRFVMRQFEDPSNIDAQSQASESPQDDGLEVRLAGEPICLVSEHKETSLPEKYRAHPYVSGRYFFTLPPTVLHFITDVVGEDRFDAELLTMERELSRICGDHASSVEFWKNRQIRYQGLRTQEVPLVSPESAAAYGIDAIKNLSENWY